MNALEEWSTPSTEDHCNFFNAGHPNSELNQRYSLVGRLGKGRRSSVWLAKDIYPHQWRLSRFVAIKILSADATQAQSVICDEIFIIRHVQRTLATQGRLYPVHKHFTSFFNKFIIADDCGAHLCLAMEPCISFWTGIRGPFKALSVTLAKDATRQLLAALRFLHDECGVVHRDIRPENLLVSLTPGDMGRARYDSAAHKSSRPGQSPGTMAVLDGLPLSVPANQGDYFMVNDRSEKLVHNIKLAGFGSAILIRGGLPSIEPYVYCSNMSAPEILLGITSDFGTDIWSLGCLVYELITGYPLFEFPRDDLGHHLQLMQEMAEENFNISYIRQWRQYNQYIDPTTNVPYTEVEDPPNIDDKLVSHRWISWMDDSDRDVFTEFFGTMICLHSSDRGTAAELLEHRWLQSQ